MSGLRIGGINLAGFFGAQPDTTAKLAGFAFAFEHLEVMSYELLRRVAESAWDEETARTPSASRPRTARRPSPCVRASSGRSRRRSRRRAPAPEAEPVAA